MLVISMLSLAEFGPNDHREDALHFICFIRVHHVAQVYTANMLFSVNSESSLFKTCLVKLLCGLSVFIYPGFAV